MRAFQAICYVLTIAREKKLCATQYVIVKSLFIADRMHLNRFGRPITFDNYVAMDHGPVPSFSYNVLKGDANLNDIGIRKLPWTTVSAPEIGKNARLFSIDPQSKIEFDELSESDQDALSQALVIVNGLTFKQLRKITHEDAAYEDAWDDDGGKKSYPMSYGLLFEVPNFERAEDLVFTSKYS